MNFLYPSLLWVLLPLGFLLWWSRNRRMDLIHTIILILLLLSLARPIQPHALQEAQIDSREILIALDVSYSMKATDIKPTRYDFAKETIFSFLTQNPSDNVMLIAFTSNPLILSPPTTDHPLIRIALQSLNLEYILTKGTSLKKLFEKIASLNNRPKEVILISDGGEESDIGLKNLLQEHHISLHILALGSTKGTSIQTSSDTLLKDQEGNLVISRINPFLKVLASSRGSSYHEASPSAETTASLLNDALEEIKNQKNLIQKMQSHHKEYYTYPLLLALLLFLLLHTRGLKYLIIILTFLGIHTEASLYDTYHLIHAYKAYEKKDFNRSQVQLEEIEISSLESHLLLAHNYYKQEKYKQALKVYLSIRSSQRESKQYIYYHIANTHAMLQTYDKAKHYYTKALQLGEDADAQYNMHLIALLKDTREASLGIAHPKSQSDSPTKSSTPSSEKEQNKEDTPSSSNTGNGEGSSQEKNKEKAPSKRLSDDNEQEQMHPLSSKVYELINKGYIRETHPW